MAKMINSYLWVYHKDTHLLRIQLWLTNGPRSSIIVRPKYLGASMESPILHTLKYGMISPLLSYAPSLLWIDLGIRVVAGGGHHRFSLKLGAPPDSPRHHCREVHSLSSVWNIGDHSRSNFALNSLIFCFATVDRNTKRTEGNRCGLNLLSKILIQSCIIPLQSTWFWNIKS